MNKSPSGGKGGILFVGEILYLKKFRPLNITTQHKEGRSNFSGLRQLYHSYIDLVLLVDGSGGRLTRRRDWTSHLLTNAALFFGLVLVVVVIPNVGASRENCLRLGSRDLHVSFISVLYFL